MAQTPLKQQPDADVESANSADNGIHEESMQGDSADSLTEAELTILAKKVYQLLCNDLRLALERQGR